ncbi:MAG TPA: excinuclease ABC subunit UvrC [Verrucomicrobiae bacterium]|jgi:excinuclease ABC subunit C|nr:excinuclease ABC subunit UvrC [Verrucomicrobiae bacterium]
MEPREKAALLPDAPGVYLFRDAGGTVLYVGKAISLRSRVRSYFLESSWINAKTGSLAREIADLETILVANAREALALEHNLIKQYRPKFNVLLRDDKTYPYIKFTASEKFPRVYFTRRVKKDGSLYFGPYFPASLARRILHFIHKRFLVPSCTVDLTRSHPRPCLQYYIKRCQGPCVDGLTTEERYAEAARDVRLFLEGRRHDLMKSLEQRMGVAAEQELYEQAAAYRDLLRTLEDIEERQRIASSQGDDTDVLAYHAEAPLVAANLFHLRGGRAMDRREYYWEDLEEFDPKEFVPSLLKQIYLEAAYLPKAIHVPVDFEDRALLEEALSERAGHKVEIFTPQRGSKRAFRDLVENNAAHSFEQRFRVLKPTSKAISEAVQAALNLPEEPQRIESFDISHIQGSDTVASMVVWENGRMKKSDYRKFIIRGEGSVEGEPGKNDDFASMRETVTRRYSRVLREKRVMPNLILIDGGIGQLRAAAQALESLQIINQPLASIAKREEILYIYGQEDEPCVLDHHSPVLHLIQQIRDETHRFAVTFHRLRRGKRQIKTALRDIPGVGPLTAQRLLREFGSVANVQRAGVAGLSRVITRKSAEKILAHLNGPGGESSATDGSATEDKTTDNKVTTTTS